MPDERDVFLCQAQRLARGHQDLLLHQVHSREHLRHRVFDLDAGVHLDKVEVVPVDQKLHRPCVGVPSLPRQPDGGVAHPLADLVAMPGDGASSSTFCLRRCMEHSLS